MVDRDRYRGLFVQEAREHLEALGSGLDALAAGWDPKRLDALFRAAHSFKGMAATVGYQAESDLAHELEDVLDHARSVQGLDAATRALLVEAVDLLALAVDAAEAGQAPPDLRATTDRLRARHAPGDVAEDHAHAAWPDDLAARLAAAPPERLRHVTLRLAARCAAPRARMIVLTRMLEQDGRVLATRPDRAHWDQLAAGDAVALVLDTDASPERLQTRVDQIPDLEDIHVHRGPPHGPAPGRPDVTPRAPADTSVPAPSRAPRTVRVDLALVDRLLDTGAEMRIAFQRLERQLDDAFLGRRPYALQEALERLAREAKEVHDLTLDLRTLPVRVIAERFPRLVRALATRLDKHVALTLDGTDTQADRSVLDALIDPLTHLMKNALDHGIEPPAERTRAGKPTEGTLSIRFARTDVGLEVTVGDDGRGIDPAFVLRRAVERGLVSPEEAAAMDDTDTLRLITLPGFTTAHEVTDVSGRGVGLDSVKADIERIGGRMRLESTRGAGTSVTLELPRTLALVEALAVLVDSEPYLVPVDAIVTTVAVTDEDAARGTVSFIDPRKVRLERKPDEAEDPPGPFAHTLIRPPPETVPIIRLADVLGLGARLYRRVEEDRASRIERLQAELRAATTQGAAGAPRATAPVPGPPLGIVVERHGRRACLLPDEVGTIREYILKGFDPGRAGLRHVAGATIQGDGLVGLIIDVPSILAADRPRMAARP